MKEELHRAEQLQVCKEGNYAQEGFPLHLTDKDQSLDPLGLDNQNQTHLKDNLAPEDQVLRHLEDGLVDQCADLALKPYLKQNQTLNDQYINLIKEQILDLPKDYHFLGSQENDITLNHLFLDLQLNAFDQVLRIQKDGQVDLSLGHQKDDLPVKDLQQGLVKDHCVRLDIERMNVKADVTPLRFPDDKLIDLVNLFFIPERA